MPRRTDKKKRKKTKKNKLTTEEILMLLKKLKPKTSQNVRVNVGAGKGEKSSYTSPFVVPQQPSVSYTFAQGQPLTAPTPLPLPPPPIAEPTAIPIVPKKPVERKPKKIIAMATPYTDAEEDTYSLYSRKTFKEPPQNKSSNLSAYASSYARMPPSSQYTQYPVIDLSAPESDEAGTAPNALSQDEWTGSPDGTNVPYNEMQNQPPMNEGGATITEPTMQEAFAAEEEQVFAEEPTSVISGEAQPMVLRTPKKTPTTPLSDVFISTPQQKRRFIEEYIEKNNRITPIPKQYLVSIGATRKGTLKRAITDRDINYIYELAKADMISNLNKI